MKILVTGGAGYIGSQVAHDLLQAGHDVVVYDNLSTGHREFVDPNRLIVGDISDRSLLCGTMRGMDAVVHFAGCAYVGESVSNPRKYFANNVTSAITLLNAAVDSGIKNFVFSSSCAVYGIPVTLPITEETSCRPVNPYGESKLFFERALHWYGHAYGLKFVCLRYFNAAGADEGCRSGELHDPETHLIPLALEAAAGHRSRLEIYGADYPTPDGTCVRDYVHVMDLSKAHILALHHICSTLGCGAINLGTGSGYSVREVITSVEKVTGRSVPTYISARRSGDPAVLVASADRAQQLLGWRSTRGLEEMIASAWQWLRSRRNVH
jgi:UDP-glucose-4-epimerase GalE